MRAKLANESRELLPLVLLGQLPAARRDSQRVSEAQLPHLHLQRQTTQKAPPADEPCPSAQAQPRHIHLFRRVAQPLREQRKLRLGDSESPSPGVEPTSLAARLAVAERIDPDPGVLFLLFLWPLAAHAALGPSTKSRPAAPESRPRIPAPYNLSRVQSVGSLSLHVSPQLTFKALEHLPAAQASPPVLCPRLPPSVP